MVSVMSDLHKAYETYEAYLQMLEKIRLNSSDTLYILGNVVDRGGKSIGLPEDTARRKNVFVLMGSHDAVAPWMLQQLCMPVTSKNTQTHLDAASAHAPTAALSGRHEILFRSDRTFINRGVSFGGRLRCLRLDGMRAFYV